MPETTKIVKGVKHMTLLTRPIPQVAIHTAILKGINQYVQKKKSQPLNPQVINAVKSHLYCLVYIKHVGKR